MTEGEPLGGSGTADHRADLTTQDVDPSRMTRRRSVFPVGGGRSESPVSGRIQDLRLPGPSPPTSDFRTSPLLVYPQRLPVLTLLCPDPGNLFGNPV